MALHVDDDKKKGKVNVDLVVLGSMLGFLFFLTIYGALTGNLKQNDGISTTINCPQARSQWESALEARDAVTPASAMTYSGRAKWEQLRDKANELEQVKNNLCN